MPNHRALLEEFEPRILYSADLAAALGLAAGGAATGWGSASTTLQPHEQQLVSAAQPSATRLEIAFVDLGVTDAQTLVAGLAAQRDGGRALEIVTIAAGEDGLAVISQTLQLRHDISAVHLYSHGSPGQAQLGSSMLNHDTALQRAHELAGWGSALTSDADLLIYGCDVAATAAGQALVRDLAALTGADVGASTDRTGASARGGDWVLESSSGPIEASAALSAAALQGYGGILANTPPQHTLPAPPSVQQDRSLSFNAGGAGEITLADAEAGGGLVSVDLSVTQGTLSLSQALGDEFRLNATTASAQQAPRIAVAADGHYVVVWHSNGQDGSKNGVYARLFDADGTPRSAEIAVNTTTTDDQEEPAVAIDASGRFVIAWQSYDANRLTWDIYARSFAADGSALSNQKRITSDADSQTAPAVAMDAAGNVVIAYQSKGQDDLTSEGIYARTADTALSTIQAEFRVNATTAGNQEAPAVARHAGGFVVVWHSNGQDGSGRGVYGQRYNSAGAAQGSEFRINQTTAGDQSVASVAANSDGSFVVAWQSAGQDGSGFGIWARRYDSAATALAGEFRVNTTGSDDQTQPVVAIGADGAFAIAWTSAGQDHIDGKSGVYVQGFAADGSALGLEFRANATTENDQVAPSIALQPAGDLVAVWQSKNQDGSGDGIYGQRFLPPGALHFSIGDGTADSTMRFTGTLAHINLALDSLSYTPTAGYWGAAELTLTTNDLGSGAGPALSTTSTLAIQVLKTNLPPTTTVPLAQATAEDVPVVFSTANGNAITIADPDADPAPVQLALSVSAGTLQLATSAGLSIVSGTDGSSAITVQGRLAALNSALDGLVYTPAADAIGAVTLTVTADDLGNSQTGGRYTSTGTVVINASAVNDAPVNLLPTAPSTPEGTVLTMSTANGNRVALADIDAGSANLEVTLIATHGTLQMGRTNNLSFTVGDGGGGEQRMTFRGTLANINLGLDGLRFTPADGYAGPAFLEMLSSDLGSSGAGGSLADRDVLEITVAPDASNAAPVITMPANQVTTEEVPLELSLTGGSLVSVQDDAGGQPIRVTLTVDYGALTLGASTGAEFQVASAVAGDQQAARVAMAPGGGHVVVWQSQGQDGSGSGIYLQRFSDDGLALGPEQRVNSRTAGDQAAPGVAVADDGRLVVVWQGKDQDGSGWGLFGQRFDASGLAQGAEFPINTTTAGDQAAPAVATDSAGNFVVVWQSKDQDGGGWGVYGQRFGADGVAQGAEFRINTTTPKDQMAPAVAMGAGGGFVVTWQSVRQDGDDWGVYARRFDAAGVAQGSETRVNTVTFKDQLAPAVAADDAGNFVIAWQSKDVDYNDDRFGIFAQRFAADGSARGAQFLVNSTRPNDQTAPSLAMSSNGDFTVVWQAKRLDFSDDHPGVGMQRYTADGTRIGGEVVVNTHRPKAQTAPAAAMSDDGRLLVAWTSDGQDGSGLGVFAQRFIDLRSLSFNSGDGVADASMSFTGTLVQVNDVLDGLIYTPAVDFDGRVRLTVAVDDLGHSGTGGAKLSDDSLTIDVAAVNDAPVVTLPAPQTTVEGTPLVLSAANGNQIVVTDADAETRKLLVTLSAPVGTVTLAALGGLQFSAGDGSADTTMTFTATQQQLAAALDGMQLALPATFTGATAVRIAVNDQGNDGSGGALLTDAVLDVQVLPGPTNQTPVVLVPAPQRSAGSTPLVLAASAGRGISVVDDAGDGLVRVTIDASGGTATLSGAIGDETTVNRTTLGAQLDGRIALLPGGAHVVVWTSDGTDGSGDGIYAQRIDAAGARLGSDWRVNTTTASDQETAAVAANGSGAFAVVWVSNGQDGSGRGIYLQRYAAGGVAQGAETRVNTTIDGDQVAPSVAMAADGSVVVAWQSADGSGQGVYAQRFDAQGEPAGTEFLVNTTTASDQEQPRAASDGAGNFTIVWQGRDADGEGILARRFDSAGQPLGAEFIVNTTVSGKQELPALAMNAAGDWVVGWRTDGNGDDIAGQRFDAAGNRVGAAFTVNTTTNGDQDAPAVAIGADGSTAFAWQSSDANGKGIFGQVFGANGLPVGREQQVNTTTAGDQVGASLDLSADGSWRVVWTGANQDGSSTGIATQRMLHGDELAFSTGDGVSDARMVFTGTLAAANAALDRMVFVPTGGAAGMGSLRVTVDDQGGSGSGGARTGTATLQIVVGNAPLIDLDADNSGTASSGDYRVSYPVLGGARPIVDVDATLTDPDSTRLSSLTVRIGNPQDGTAETLTASVNGTSIVSQWDAASATLSLTSSVDSVANFQRVLRTVSYTNTAASPDTMPRIITFVARDSTEASNTATTALTFAGFGARPAAVGDAYTTPRDTVLVVAGSGLLANDFEIDGNLLTAVLVNGPSSGTLESFVGDGSFTYRPEPGFRGTASFSYLARSPLQDSEVATVTIVVGQINAAPVGTSNAVTTLEDTAYTFAVADFGFTDPANPLPNALLNVKVTSLPATGVLSLSGSAVGAGQFVSALDIAAGQLRFTPAAHAQGAGYTSYTFQVQDDDGTDYGGVDLDATPRTMTLNVTAVNDAPVRTAGTVVPLSVLEDAVATSLGLGALAYAPGPAADESAQTLTYRVTGVPSAALGTITLTNGTTTVTANTAYTLAQLQGMKFKPTANASGGPATFTWTVTDSGGTLNGGINTLTESLTVSVTPVNDAPVGTTRTVTTLEDTAYTFSAADFVFTDPSDSPAHALLAVKMTTLPASGSLAVSGVAVTAGQFVSAVDIGSGKLRYTPASNVNGTGVAAFTFQVQDSGGTANGGVDLDATPRTLTVNVTAVNDVPVRTAGTVANLSVLEDTAASTSLGLGALSYTPGAAANESAQTLTYRVTAVPTAALGTVTLADGTTTVTANTVYTLAQLQGMRFKAVADANGGPATFSWTVRDSGGITNGGLDTLTESLGISVTPVNDAPRGTASTVVMAQDTTRTLSRADFGFTDAAGDSNAFAAVRLQLPGAGTLALAGVTLMAPTEVTVAQLDAGQLSFTPAAGASGAAYASVGFQVRDDGGTAQGGVDLDPVQRSLSFSVVAAGTVTGQVWFTTGGPVAFAGGTGWSTGQIARYGDGLDRFDTNFGGVTLGTVSLLNGFSAPVPIRALHHVQSTLTIGTTGAQFTLVPGDLLLVLDPGAAPATVTLNTADGNPANNLVVERRDIVVYRPATAGNYASGEYFMLLDNGAHVGATTYNVHALSLVETATTVGDVTLPVGTFVIAHSDTSVHNNVYTFSASGTGVGAATQTSDRSLLISGSRLGLASGGDKIMGLHLLAQATSFNDSTLGAGTLLVSIDGGTNTYAGVTAAAFDVVALTVTATGASTAGSGQLLFDGSDLGLDAAIGFNTAAKNLQGLTVVTSTVVNIAPTFSSAAAASVPEGTTLVHTLGASDPEAQAVSFSVAGGADMTRFSIDGSNRLMFAAAPDFLAPADANGDNVYVVQVRATDSGGASSLQLINVTVSNVNASPVLALPISDQSVSQGTPYAFTVPAGTFVDPDGDSLLYIANLSPNLALPSWLSFNASTLSFSGTPGQADVGAVTLRLWAVDPDDTFATSDFTLTVADVNDAPVITSNGGGDHATITSAENDGTVTTGTATDIDPAAPALQFAIVGGADAARFDIDGVTGVLRFFVAPDHEAPADADADNVYELTVQASDGQLSDSQTLSVTVTPVNESAPVITSDGGAGNAAITLAENTTAVTVVTATDADLPAATLNYSIAGGADAAAFTINGSTGVLSFVSAPDFELPTDAGANNSYFVDVAVSDGSFTSTQQIRVNVTDLGGPLVVTTTADVLDGNVSSVEALVANPGADGLISLREAISAANQTAGAHTIMLGAGSYGIGIAADGTGDDNLDGDFDIQGNLTITGAGVASTVVTGNTFDRVFDVSPGASLSLGGVTVQGGQLAANDYGGGVYVRAGGALLLSGVSISGNQAGSGAGVYVLGTLTATDTTLANNVAPNWGGGIYNDRGTVVLDRVTLSGNQAGRDGGGINNAGSGAALSLNNVTLSGNTAGGNGGGLFTNRGITINSSTIAFNTSVSGAAGLHLQGSGSATLSNTILYNPGGSGSNSALASGGHNLDADGTAGLAGSGDLRGTAGTPLDPMLGTLQDNGGATWTHALLATSPAINAGDTATAAATDQRGGGRVGNADIGAYEFAGTVNRAPINTVPGALSVPEDTVALISGVAVADPDNGGGLSLNELSTTALGVAHGTLRVTLVGDAFVSAGANGSTGLTLSGSAASINATLTSLLYLGNADHAGNDTLTVTSRDGAGLSDTDTVAITVTAVNDPPQGTDGARSLAAGTSLMLTRADFGFSDAAGESDRFMSVLVQTPSQGTLRLDGVLLSAATEVTVAQLDAGLLVFVPAPGAPSGPHATLDFQVRDDGGTASGGVDLDPTPATLSLALDNRAPVITSPGMAAALALSQPEGRTAVVTVGATDPDAGAVLTWAIAGGADAALFTIDAASGQLGFTAAPDFENPLDADADNAYLVEVKVGDGSLTDTVALTLLITDVEHRIDVTTTADVVDGDTSSVDALWAQPGADGLVSLREALIAANQTPGLDTIGFEIAAPLLGGAHTMQLASELPDLVSPVIIDGRSESDFSAVPVIELDGQGLLSHGLRLAAGSDGSTLLGLAINRYTGDAVQVVGSGGHTLAGNHLGTDVTGRIALGNGGAGIWSDGSGITIGGTTPLDANVIAGNGSAGIWLDNGASNIVIAGNRLGLGLGGEALGNATGIHLGSAVRDVRIGGTALGAGNTIAHSAGDGIRVDSAAGSGNHWLANRIADNGGMGIELGSDGVTANDVGDVDGGPNNLQNHPLLSAAVSTGADAFVTGNLRSNPDTNYRVEFFSAAAADASGHGPGAIWLGAISVSTNGGGNASFNTMLNGVAVNAGHVISAVAVVDLGGGAYGDASEFGPAVMVGTLNVAPVITSDGGAGVAAVSVPENTPFVTRVTASDSNLPAQSLLYSIVGGADAAHFVIKPSSGELTFTSVADFEAPADSDANNVYEVQVQVSDGALVDVQQLSVTVVDSNEFSVSGPVDVDATANSVSEDAAPGTLTGLTAQASDADGSNHTVRYTLTDSAGGLFSIDAATGVVRVAGPLDAETASSHVVTVRASSSDGSSRQASFNIAVQDIDEFDVGALSDADAAAERVAETAANGTPVGITAQASDADTSNSRISYTLIESAGGLFSIDAATGVVRVAGPLDAETAGSHVVTVRASSSDGSSRQASFNIAVQDIDEFDTSAVSDTDAATERVAETAAIGTPVGITAQASDGDTSNSRISYTLDNDAGGRFAIDADSGLVTVARALGEAGAVTHRIVVAARSADGSSSARAFEVDVVPQNNHDPVITSDGAAATALLVIDEGITRVTVVSAVDADLPPAALRYSLSGGADAALFSIDADTGALRLATAPDFEAPSDANGNGVYEVMVSVSDGQASASQALSVRVANVNEAPVFNRQALLLSQQGVTLVLQARDPDGATAVLAYEVMSTRDGHFELQGAPGGVLRGFTQADVDAARVIFVANSSSGLVAPSPSFLLAISDGVHRVEGGAPEIVGTLPAPPAAVAPAAVPEPAPQPTEPPAVAEVATSAPVPAPAAVPAETATVALVSPQPQLQPLEPALVQPLALEAPLGAAAAVAAPPSAAAERWSPTVVVPDALGTRPAAISAEAAFWAAGLAELEAPARLALGQRDSTTLDLIGSRNASTLAQAMDAARSSVEEANTAVELGVASTALVSSGLSVGYVLWLARGGVLAASLMSSVPAWASVDPLPVLKHMRRGADGEADEGPDGDEIDPIDRLFSRARRLLAGTAAAGGAPQAAQAADKAPDRASAGPTAAAGPPQREAEPWAS